MPLYIKDETTAQLVNALAKQRGMTKQDAVKMAVTAALQLAEPKLSIPERLARLRRENPIPPKTGLPADKAFFDDLSGEAD